jgi:hypothetical protein
MRDGTARQDSSPARERPIEMRAQGAGAWIRLWVDTPQSRELGHPVDGPNERRCPHVYAILLRGAIDRVKCAIHDAPQTLIDFVLGLRERL